MHKVCLARVNGKKCLILTLKELLITYASLQLPNGDVRHIVSDRHANSLTSMLLWFKDLHVMLS